MVRRLLRREEIRYLTVAGSTTVVYLAVVAGLLWTGLHYMVAILFAQVMIITGAFPTYRRLIFRTTGGWRGDLPRFVGVWTGGFIAGIFATPALVELVGLSPLLAQVIAVAAVAAFSYLGHKFISFGKRERSKATPS